MLKLKKDVSVDGILTFTLLTHSEVKDLPFDQKLLKNNLRPVIHQNDCDIYTFNLYEDDLKPNQIIFIKNEKDLYLITEDTDTLRPVLESLFNREHFLSEFIHYLLDEFYTIFSDYEDMLIELEDSLSSGSFKDVSLDSLSMMKHDAMMAEKNMRRIQYIMLNVQQRNNELAHLDGLVKNNSDYAKHLVDYVNHLLNLYNSLIAEKTNNTINKLTVLAFLATPVSMLSGIYGMNFVNMPGLYNEYGFYIIMGITFLIMLLFYLMIRKTATQKDLD